jgi:hypothetical protein
VILDLENHCSLEQQKEMARILRQVLGGITQNNSIIIFFLIFIKID